MIVLYPFVAQAPDNNVWVDCKSNVVPDATTSLSVLLNRYVRGLGIPTNQVHPAQYSEELSPLTSKGVDLCDYSAIKAQNAIDVQTLTDDAIAQDKAVKAAKAAKAAKQEPEPVTPPSLTSGE